MSTRHNSTRRTVLETVCSLGLAATGATATAAAADDETTSREDTPSQSTTTACGPIDITLERYVATVDRIVDDAHVVLLLEDDGTLVDQHVAPRSRLEDVAEGDILRVVIADGDLLVARPLPKRPGRSATEPSPQERFDSLVTDDDPAEGVKAGTRNGS